MVVINADPWEVLSTGGKTPAPGDKPPTDDTDSYELFGFQDLAIDYYQVLLHQVLLLRKVIIM